jgi:hypothetical protein
MNEPNELERLPQAGLFSLVNFLWERSRAYPIVKHSGRLQPYLQTFGSACKVCKEQTL